MLTIMAGLQSLQRGCLSFGKKVEDYSLPELQRIRAARIGFVFQSFRLLDSINVSDNIMLALKFAGFIKVQHITGHLNFLKGWNKAPV